MRAVLLWSLENRLRADLLQISLTEHRPARRCLEKLHGDGALPTELIRASISTALCAFVYETALYFRPKLLGKNPFT